MNIYEKINKIQVELKATKDNRNEFGKYNYRSAEDIYNALKPFLKEDKLILLFDEKIRIENERELLTSTIEIIDVENPVEKITKSIDVIIAKPKNGNDLTQTTGVSISYARKYLMCGAFTIDNEKDNDAINTHNTQKSSGTEKTKKKVSAEEKRKNGEDIITRNTTKYNEMINNFFEIHKAKTLSDLSNEEVSNLARKIYELEKIEKGA